MKLFFKLLLICTLGAFLACGDDESDGDGTTSGEGQGPENKIDNTGTEDDFKNGIDDTTALFDTFGNIKDDFIGSSSSFRSASYAWRSSERLTQDESSTSTSTSTTTTTTSSETDGEIDGADLKQKFDGISTCAGAFDGLDEMIDDLELRIKDQAKILKEGQGSETGEDAAKWNKVSTDDAIAYDLEGPSAEEQQAGQSGEGKIRGRINKEEGLFQIYAFSKTVIDYEKLNALINSQTGGVTLPDSEGSEGFSFSFKGKQTIVFEETIESNKNDKTISSSQMFRVQSEGFLVGEESEDNPVKDSTIEGKFTTEIDAGDNPSVKVTASQVNTDDEAAMNLKYKFEMSKVDDTTLKFTMGLAGVEGEDDTDYAFTLTKTDSGCEFAKE